MIDTQYQIEYDDFRGPANLLLELVRKRKIDIYSLRLSIIIQDFLDFVERNKNILLDTLSGFLYVSTILLEIKSSSVIPSRVSHFTEEENEPLDRSVLLQREKNYRTFNKIANYLSKMKEMEKLYFIREAPVENKFIKVLPDFLVNLSVENINRIASELLKKSDFNLDLSSIYAEDATITIIDTMERIIKMIDLQKEVTYREISRCYDRLVDKIICFLSILELYKIEKIDIIQFESFGNIVLKKL